MKEKTKKKVHDGIAGSIREIVFGAEDAFVSTLGVITGIAAGTQNAYIVILSGLVLIAVESVSMGAGSYLSSKSAMEVQEAHGLKKKTGVSAERPVRAGFVMWASYFVAGFFPLAPYFFVPVEYAYIPSILVTLFLLFVLGAWQTKFTHKSWWRSGLEMAIVSLTAAGIGFVIGRIFASVTGVGGM